MKPIKNPDGTWRVEGGGGYVLIDGLTNAEAWRYIDIANREPVNKVQDVSDWSFSKKASGS